MAADDDFVTVEKGLFDRLHQHCERCPDFDERLQDLSSGRVVFRGRSFGESFKKRKTLHQPGPQEPLPSSQEPGPQVPCQLSQTSQCKEPKGSLPRKKEAAEWFLRNAPKATEWRKRQTELELTTTEQYEEVVRALTDRTNVIVRIEPSQKDRFPEDELINLAERFALLTKASLTNARLQRSFATFQALILLSYCEVLRKRGVSYERIDPIIQHITGQEFKRKRLLDSALWINGVIDKLVSYGWTIYRATELFFINAPSLTYISHIHNDENSQSVLKHFKTDEFVGYDYSDCLRPEYTIPGLIASLLDASNITANKPLIDEIFAALGYTSGRVPKSSENIYRVHAATKSTTTTPVHLHFENLISSSFRSNDERRTTGLLSAHEQDPRKASSRKQQQIPSTADRPSRTIERDLTPSGSSHLSRAQVDPQSPSPLRRTQQEPLLPTPPSQERTSFNQISLTAKQSQPSCPAWLEDPSMARAGDPGRDIIPESVHVWSVSTTADPASVEASILSLFCAMGGRIPRFIFERAVSPQQRCNGLGEMYEITPRNGGLSAHLRLLLLEGEKLQQVIERLLLLSIIGVEESNGVEIYICQTDSAQSLYSQDRRYWIQQAFELICYVFPRRQAGNLLLENVSAALEYVLWQHAETGLELPCGNNFVETLLAASTFGPSSRQYLFLSIADKLLKDPTTMYLQAEIVHRQSVLLRLKGNVCGSNCLIQEFLNRPNPDPKTRLYFVFGLLHLSQATNYAYNFDFELAHRELQCWMPSNDTERQLDVAWDQIYCAGRILKGQGCFERAKPFFARCLAIYGLREAKRILVESNLADLYSELDYLQRKRSDSNRSEECMVEETAFLDKADEMVRPEIGRLRARAQYSKGFRRLLLSLSEVEIRRCRFDKADGLLTELCDIYSRLIEPDIVDRLGHVRTLIALARISPLSEAEVRWNEALNLNRRYNPFEEEVFTCGLIYLFICSTRLKLGNLDGSKAAFNYAVEVFRQRRPQFLIPGVGTYLFDDVQCQIKSLAGWILPRNDPIICVFS